MNNTKILCETFKYVAKITKKIYNNVCVNSFCSLFNNYEIILITNNLAYLKGLKTDSACNRVLT